MQSRRVLGGCYKSTPCRTTVARRDELVVRVGKRGRVIDLAFGPSHGPADSSNRPYGSGTPLDGFGDRERLRVGGEGPDLFHQLSQFAFGCGCFKEPAVGLVRVVNQLVIRNDSDTERT